MKRDYDEPIFVDVASCEKACVDTEIEEEIRALCLEEPFAVLATQGGGQPYTSLISFTMSDDLKHLVFSTPTQTRKYSLIVANSNVSLMIDNRSRQPESINHICGLTITGRARVLSAAEEIAKWQPLLTAKHSYLQKFVKSSSSSLILVETVRFLYVRRFQEVYQWVPGKTS